MSKRRVVVITGASAGLGRAMAREFAKEGACLALIARNEEALRHAQEEARELGSEAMIFALDVSDADAVEEAAEQIEQRWGHIDVWVNNAMISVFSPVHKMSAQEFRRVTEVTYLGYVHGTLSALRRMRARNQGLIIQVGSALAYRSIPLQSAYCASKHAIAGFTESLRTELLHEKSGVKTCMVHMPAMNTPQFQFVKSRLPNKPQPVPPIFAPEVGARAVVYASHHPRREYWVGGPTWKAIIADKLVPGLADRYLGWLGYSAQQTSEPDDPDRANNLWRHLPGDYGAHGPFTAREKSRSLQFWFTRNRNWLALAGLAGAGWLWSRQTAGDNPT